MRRSCAFWILVSGIVAAMPAEAARVVGVIDGDTLQVDVAGDVRIVHVAGVDSPDAARPKKEAEYFGVEAADFTQKNILGQEVKLTPAWQDNGTEVYVDTADGRDVGLELIRQGLAYAQQINCSRCDDFKKAERRARGTFAGLWHPDAYTKYQATKNKEVRYMGITGEGRTILRIGDYWVIVVIVPTGPRY